MSDALWSLGAAETAERIRNRQISCRDVTASVLARIDALNPKLNALPFVLREEASAAAAEADEHIARGDNLPFLLGVPATTKVNIDQQGYPTTDGAVALKDNIATSDSPPVANLKKAGCILVGRSNTPAYSLRWFTDNDLHGRTLNPWNAAITPGGSSGGAAAAVAAGMGAIAHGNDYGGSVRYPAYCCGIAGLRGTVGRFPSFNATAKGNRAITLQLMSSQGVLARSVADLQLAMRAMAAADARDPNFVPAPLAFDEPKGRIRIAMFRRSGTGIDPSVVAAVEEAGHWLAAAGHDVEAVEPPHFDEAARLWRTLVYDDQARFGLPRVQASGGAAAARNIALVLEGHEPVDRDTYLEGLARRHSIAQAWSEFFARYPVLLLPVSWKRPFPADEDIQSKERLEAVIQAQAPMLATALLGLPGLSIPTGCAGRIPMGVQLVAWRFREDLCLQAAALIEAAAGRLPPPLA